MSDEVLARIKLLATQGLVRVQCADMVQFMAGLAIGEEDILSAITSAVSCEPCNQFVDAWLLVGGVDLCDEVLRLVACIDDGVVVLSFDRERTW